MAYKVTISKEECFEQLKVLIIAFEKEYSIYKTPKYSEAQLRIDFLNPLLKTFGWDVDNEESKTQFLRDVIQEESIDVEEEDSVTKKNPDYTLRIQGFRKFFIEAKKVSVDLEKSNKPAFQTRRYGWNANLGISILTNFETLSVYDCRYKPSAEEAANVARYQSFHYSHFLSKFDELYQLLSYESVGSGVIDEYFSVTQNDKIKFDDYFLRQIENWRESLANDVIANNDGFNNEDINFLIQRLLNRIVFLRICEDREIEKYDTLRNIRNYDELKQLFILSDKKYNSGLFDFIEDNFSLNINLKSEILIEIFNELYYPQSPYIFSVVDPNILSQIYERYLGSKIAIVNERQISIVEEPEVAASSGVVPTPKLIVQNIVKETLEPLFEGKTLEQMQQLKLADICCGSGTFLISIYDYIFERITLGFVAAGVNDTEIINQVFDGSYHLTLKAKHQILTSNIYGVDINPYAVEVSKFSLLLKLLEGENSASIENFLSKHKQKVLPSLDDNVKCGNSLVDDSYFQFQPEAIENNELLFKLKPFNWDEEFNFLKQTNGFDAILGNPPYVRIQNIVKFSLEEIKFFQSKVSGYTVAESETFDKYYLFIQKAINLLNENGVLGYIVPHKFFIVKGGKALRAFITSNSSIFKIIHFGVTQVFPNRSTYTAILILDKKQREQISFKRIHRIAAELTAGSINYDGYNSEAYTEQPWLFVAKPSQTVFDKAKNASTIPLCTIADIAVGLQTSADKIYIFQPTSETETTYHFKYKNTEYEIEKAICKPCLYDLSFGLFDTVKPNAQIIFPYTIEADKAEVFPEQYFQENFPLTWAYLNNFAADLSKRSINGSKEPKWYQYGRSQSLTRFHNTQKLIWAVLSTKPGYVFDESNLQFTGGGNGPYYSLFTSSEYSLYYILGILSHPLFEAMVKSGASEFRGAYYSHGKQFIENLPIRKIDFTNQEEVKLHNELVKTVKSLIATKATFNGNYISAKKKVMGHKLDLLFNSLVEQVNSLYGITSEELNTVLNDEELNNEPKED
jgi:type I restriction-modification system DNA methylase subunit